MKNYIKIFLPFGLAILLGSLTFNFAQTAPKADGKFPGGDGRGFGPRRGPTGGGVPPFVLDKLNLTAQQKEQIKSIEDAAREAAKANFDKIRAYDEALRALTDAESLDEARAREILTAKSQLMSDLELSRLKTDFAVKNVLTPEQKTQLDELKRQRPEPPRDGFRPPMPPPAPEN